MLSSHDGWTSRFLSKLNTPQMPHIVSLDCRYFCLQAFQTRQVMPGSGTNCAFIRARKRGVTIFRRPFETGERAGTGHYRLSRKLYVSCPTDDQSLVARLGY